MIRFPKVFVNLLILVFFLILSSCTQTGTFHITDIETEDPSISKEELNHQLSRMIGKSLTIEKYGDNLRVQLEGEPDIWIFSYDSKYSGVVNYVAYTKWGKYNLQYRVLFDLFSGYSVTSGRIYTFKNGEFYSMEFK